MATFMPGDLVMLSLIDPLTGDHVESIEGCGRTYVTGQVGMIADSGTIVGRITGMQEDYLDYEVLIDGEIEIFESFYLTAV